MLTQTESSIPTAHHVANADDQTEILEKMKTKCMEKIMEEERLRSSADVIENITKRCPRVWDGIMCWSEVNPGDTSIQPCPDYIAGFDTTAKATRQCLQSGDWFYRDDPERTWTNYSQCIPNSYASLVISYPQLESNESIGTYLEEWIPVVKTISRLGYTVSLFTLIVAFVIMVSIKKLRCPRNTLHMHLFASFIMRAFMSLLKDSLFINGIGLSHDVFVQNGETFVLSESGHSWECKMVVSLWQFFIMANYSWVLMEGLYLHNLIFLPMSSDTSSITMYAILGWGIPVVVVVPWIILRAVLEDTLCWTTNDNSLFFLVIRIPIVISILINFAMFVNIVRVVYLKLQSSPSEDTRRDRHRRWAKSTLVLVPLFGVHYAVFLGMSYSIGVNQVMEIIWLFCDQFFASFQGSVIAILYCFMNGEVRAELNKKWICFFKRLKHKGGKAHWLPSSENSADNNTSSNGAGGPLFMFPQNGRKLHSIASKGKKVCFEGIESDGGTESDDKHVTSMEREQNIKLKSFNMMNLPHFGRQMSAPAGYVTSDAKLSNRGRWILQENGGKGSRLFSKALGQSEFFQNTKRLVKKWSQTGGVGKNREESPLNSSSCCTTHFSVDCEENAIENGEFIGDEESMCQSPMQSEEISPKCLQQQGAERHGIPLHRSYSVGAYLKTHYTDDISENWKTDVKEDLFDEDDQYPKS